MKWDTFNRLEKIRNKFGSQQFGKIAQKLLALSFYEMGYTHIVERGVQGVDIDIKGEEGKKYAIEVKTTNKSSINLSSDNIQALLDRSKDSYSPIIAVLRLLIFGKWIIARTPLSEISTGNILIDRLRAYRMISLERNLEPVFDNVVETHFEKILRKGERYLKKQLNKIGIETRDF